MNDPAAVARVLAAVDPEVPGPSLDALALSVGLDKLAVKDPRAAELVKLRYFAGLTVPQVAEMIGVSASTVDNYWAYARAWLRVELSSGSAQREG